VRAPAQPSPVAEQATEREQLPPCCGVQCSAGWAGLGWAGTRGEGAGTLCQDPAGVGGMGAIPGKVLGVPAPGARQC
jgi:hypothetical protein